MAWITGSSRRKPASISRQCYEHASRTVVLDEDKEVLKKLVID